MKSLPLISITAICLTLSVPVIAQTADLEAFLVQLKQTEVFRECELFKNSIEQDARSLVANPSLTSDQREKLRLAYTGVYSTYDSFLKAVKQDLMNTQRLQALVRNPAKATQNYTALYALVKTEYEQMYLPVTQSISSNGKSIRDDLKAFGSTIFSTIATGLAQQATGILGQWQSQRQQQQAMINALLPVVNETFYNDLRLKMWSELDVSSSFSHSVVSAPVNRMGSVSGSTPYTTTGEAIVIPAPTVSGLAGSVAFVQISGTQEQPMNFQQRTGKDIDIVTDSPSDHTTVKDQYFSTIETYAVGSRFRLKVFNNAFSYVLVLNSDGVRLLHPRVQTSPGKSGKDIEIVQDVKPQVGDVQIPSTGSFAITPSKTGSESMSEDFALLLSKAELSIEEIIEKLNFAPGNLSERIAEVFGGNRIATTQAGVQVAGNRFTFDATNAPESVLPLVFQIRK